MSNDTDVAVVGAGPYGLSVAAHLAARGLDHRVFGAPLSTWRERMPAAMLLKSDGFASDLSTPGEGWSLRQYCSEHGLNYHDTDIPVALSGFVDYGLSFQQRLVPHLEPRQVTGVAPEGGGWRVSLDDGTSFRARRVVVAAGVTHFDQSPEVFAGLPAGLVSHSSAHRTFERFAGADVTVIGRGSSAVEVAVSLADAGARPRMVARREKVKFRGPPTGRPRSLWDKVRHPSSGLGPSIRSRLACDLPDVYRAMPGWARIEALRRHLGPSSPWHLEARLAAAAEVLTRQRVAAVSEAGGRVRLDLTGADGERRAVETDHVICATGYWPDVARLAFLDSGTRGRLRTVAGAPVLSAAFESSAPGLYFVGLAAAPSFGPLMRFIYGDAFTARRLTGHLARRTP